MHDISVSPESTLEEAPGFIIDQCPSEDVQAALRGLLAAREAISQQEAVLNEKKTAAAGRKEALAAAVEAVIPAGCVVLLPYEAIVNGRDAVEERRSTVSQFAALVCQCRGGHEIAAQLALGHVERSHEYFRSQNDVEEDGVPKPLAPGVWALIQELNRDWVVEEGKRYFVIPPSLAKRVKKVRFSAPPDRIGAILTLWDDHGKEIEDDHGKGTEGSPVEIVHGDTETDALARLAELPDALRYFMKLRAAS